MYAAGSRAASRCERGPVHKAAYRDGSRHLAAQRMLLTRGCDARKLAATHFSFVHSLALACGVSRASATRLALTWLAASLQAPRACPQRNRRLRERARASEQLGLCYVGLRACARARASRKSLRRRQARSRRRHATRPCLRTPFRLYFCTRGCRAALLRGAWCATWTERRARIAPHPLHTRRVRVRRRRAIQRQVCTALAPHALVQSRASWRRAGRDCAPRACVVAKSTPSERAHGSRLSARARAEDPSVSYAEHPLCVVRALAVQAQSAPLWQFMRSQRKRRPSRGSIARPHAHTRRLIIDGRSNSCWHSAKIWRAPVRRRVRHDEATAHRRPHSIRAHTYSRSTLNFPTQSSINAWVNAARRASHAGGRSCSLAEV